MSVARLSAAFVASSMLLGCGGGSVVLESQGKPLTVERPALYPETIEYDASADRFLLGSFREGAIYAVDRAGRASLLVDDPRLCSVLGIAVDSRRSRLWAVTGDLGASTKPSAAGPRKLAGIGVYDLRTGKPIHYVDVSALADSPHLPNGIALDEDGNAFVTDSFAPVIYKITNEGRAVVFVRDERFAGAAINLNGVVVHPDGYLLVVNKSDGTLYKVPLDRPASLSEVAADRKFVGGDGVTLAGKTRLVLIANRTPDHETDAAFSLSSEDGWRTATVAAVRPLGDVYPTTAVIRDGTLYVVQSKLNRLIAAPPEKKAELRERATIVPIGRVTAH